MSITDYRHTAILVSDLDRAEWFYGEVLGLTQVERPFRFPGTWYQVGAMQLHLIVSESPSRELASEKWGRNPHVAFGIDDLDGMLNRLEAAGCPIQRSASGRPALFTQDPDGNIVELSAE
ncbi:VOC family protein [Phormidium yuhuli AB48]|uniref:VOC family protein n=1 Tax=Phormidium yuhuli AB48 TaxID=2940671 RepID=A0ABY5AXR1_9CYAN|nr:VOC family protein [Phormidium yuhuli]USR93024.1 VOC family protein [Phormidium yuhuli AB48]